MSRIYKTNPYYEIPSTTVKIVYDDDEPEFEGEELPIEELSIETLSQTYGHAQEEIKAPSEKELLDALLPLIGNDALWFAFLLYIIFRLVLQYFMADRLKDIYRQIEK